MLASVAAITSSVAHECSSEFRSVSGNPWKDCLEPLVNQVTNYLADAAKCAAEWSMLEPGAFGAPGDSPLKSHNSELWYGALDFERFKEELVAEARSAGYSSPQQQYHHIKRQYLDELTIQNTAMNLHRTASTPCTSSLEMSAEPTSPTTKPKRVKGHKRSVSFDLNDVRGVQPGRQNVEQLGLGCTASGDEESKKKQSIQDEVGRILDGEDDPELAEIFL